MKKIIVLGLSVLFFVSCVNDDTFPKTEIITKGAKWNLRIGKSPIEVYTQLQELGVEKNFDDVNISYRLPYNKPEDIKSDLSLYRGITLQAPSERIERVLIQFDQNKVEAIEKGGGLLDPITKWPENMSDQNTIHLNDPIDGIQQKLKAIYQNPTYEKYKITLSNKWLQKAFDPDMSNYKEWYFTFSTDVSFSKGGISGVTLYFKDGKLFKIRHQYNEAKIVY